MKFFRGAQWLEPIDYDNEPGVRVGRIDGSGEPLVVVFPTKSEAGDRLAEEMQEILRNREASAPDAALKLAMKRNPIAAKIYIGQDPLLALRAAGWA